VSLIRFSFEKVAQDELAWLQISYFQGGQSNILKTKKTDFLFNKAALFHQQLCDLKSQKNSKT